MRKIVIEEYTHKWIEKITELNKELKYIRKENRIMKRLLEECKFLIDDIPLIRKIGESDLRLRSRFLTYRDVSEQINRLLQENEE